MLAARKGCVIILFLAAILFLPNFLEFLSKHDVDEGLDENLRIKPP